MYEIELREEGKHFFVVVINKWTNTIKDYFHLGEAFYFKGVKEGLLYQLNKALDIEFADDKPYDSYNYRRVLRVMYNFQSNGGKKKRLRLEESYYWNKVVIFFEKKLIPEKFEILENKISKKGQKRVLDSIMRLKFSKIPKDYRDKIEDVKELLDANSVEETVMFLLYITSYKYILRSDIKIEQEKQIINLLKQKLEEVRG